MAALAIAVILAGCGGSDDSGSGGQINSGSSEQANGGPIATSSLSKAAYVKKASVVCNKVSTQASQDVNTHAEEILQSEEPPEPVLLARVLKEVILPSYETEIADVRKLGAPAGDEEKIEAMLVAQQAAVDKAKQLQAVISPKEFEKYFTKVSGELEAYGFTACAH